VAATRRKQTVPAGATAFYIMPSACTTYHFSYFAVGNTVPGGATAKPKTFLLFADTARSSLSFLYSAFGNTIYPKDFLWFAFGLLSQTVPAGATAFHTLPSALLLTTKKVANLSKAQAATRRRAFYILPSAIQFTLTGPRPFILWPSISH
jgi:hypothetical protein